MRWLRNSFELFVYAIAWTALKIYCRFRGDDHEEMFL